MPERRAISTVAAITLGALSCVLGLGMIARSVQASPEPLLLAAPSGPSDPGVALTLSVLGLEPGAVALLGLSGVVSFWPSDRRRRATAKGADTPARASGAGASADAIAPVA